MALELRQSLGLAQQLIMTPQLQQAIKLLQLSRLELQETITQEMEMNPVLEELTVGDLEEHQEPGENPEDLAPEKEGLPEVTVEERARDDVDWENYLSEYNTGWSETAYEERETPSFENLTASRTSLSSHLTWQLNMGSFGEEAREIGTFIIGNLDENGYLDLSIEDIAAHTGYDVEEVSHTLKIIQNFDPLGIGAKDARECLAIQVAFHGLNGTLVDTLIQEFLGDLEERRYERIAKTLNITLEEVFSAVTIIRGFEPRPGRLYSDEETFYITPDIYIFKAGDDYEIVQNEDGLPKLRISSYYKDILRDKARLSDSTKVYIQDKLRSAAWLIKSIHQRQRTIYKVTESIVRFQRPFFDKGIAYLKPLVLRDVAEDIQMHESTISRVTTNKYAYTPQGLFELKFFFNSSINRVDGDAVASESVKDLIRRIVQGEDKANPYSDHEIELMLQKQNIDVARRTVAKYRESLGILPSRKRRDLLAR